MRHRQTILLALLFVGLGVWTLIAHRAHKEPTHQGKTLSQWIWLYWNDSTPPTDWAPQSRQKLVTDAVRHIGTNAYPLLLKWVSYDGFSHRAQFFAKLGPLSRIPILQRFYPRTSDFRAAAAAKALICLGPDASPAFPELVRIIDDTNTLEPTIRALWILRETGEPGVLVLAAAAADKQNHARTAMIDDLALVGTNALPAVPTLTNLLHDPDPAVRYATKQALRAITPSANYSPN